MPPIVGDSHQFVQSQIASCSYNLVQPLTEKGFIVFGYDHLGCGRSAGQREHINSWDDFRSGLRAGLQLVQSTFPGLPVFQYGHSMGSLIASDFIQAN